MLSHPKLNVVRTSDRRSRAGATCWGSSKPLFESHPPVPILPATRVQLDLLLSQPVLDLQEITEAILTDVGATLQVFRSAKAPSREIGRRNGRVADCVVQLGRKRLQGAFAAVLSIESNVTAESARRLWSRARLTAELARLTAKRIPDLLPERAHLAGLFYEAGRIPATLGWQAPGIDLLDADAVWCRLVREWGLPVFVNSDFLGSLSNPGSPSQLARSFTTAWSYSNTLCRRKPLPTDSRRESRKAFIPRDDAACFPNAGADHQLCLIR